MKIAMRQQNPVNGFQLTFFTQQDHQHHHKSLGHWLVEEARAMGVSGATLITASEGFGHHRHLHRVHFIDLSEQPIEVVMAVTVEEADQLFAKLASEKIRVFYSKTPVEFGTIGGQD
jgi:PII-like signaling protein